MSDTEAATSADAGSTIIEQPQAISLDAAASRMEELDRAEAEAKTPEQREPAPPEPEDTSQPADANEDDGDEGQQEPAEDAGDGKDTSVEDLDSVELDRLHGNTKVRLRDGTEWTVGEIKRRLDDVRQVDQAKQEFTTQASQFREAQAQFAQKAQFIEQIAPRAIALLQAQLPEIPPMPDLSLRETDFFEYTAQLDDRNRAIEAYHATAAEIQQVEQAAQMQALERQQHQQAAIKGYIEEQKTKLFEKNPDLRDPAKLKEFEADLYKFGVETYGFEKKELDGMYDHRLVAVFKDAADMRKLRAKQLAKPATPAPRTSVPVSQPGRRVTATEASTQKRNELVQRARSKPGGNSLSDIASILSTIEGN